MAGIYGDMLIAFPEQLQTLTVYAMTPKVNGGWDIVPESSKTVYGICQNTTANSIKENQGNLVNSGGLELWTDTGDLDGFFMSYSGSVYRVSGNNNWNAEGGFYRYTLEKLVGNNGTESSESPWNIGGNNFS